ncbi:MAG TPA: hypothetical protein VIS76_12715 [Pseudomonadales bacterium]
MILRPGHWLGRGSLLIEGFSLGRTLECDARIEQDESGLTVSAELKFQDGERRTLGVRVAQNEVGTYALRLQSGGEVFHGSAKLESAPNLGLLWNDSETVFLTFALFPVQSGCGCRGFLRDGDTNYTWELAFSLKQDVVKGDNVVSLKGRGPRRR